MASMTQPAKSCRDQDSTLAGLHPPEHALLDTQRSEKVINYDYFINAKSKRRKPSALREIMKSVSVLPPHGVSFAVGVPNVDMFPFQEICINLKDGSNYKIEGKDLAEALQYIPSAGYGPLVKQLQELQDQTHGPHDWTQRSLLVTCGSSEPMADVFDMLINEGEPIITPLPLYTGAADSMRAYNPQYIGLEQDKDGVQPQQLQAILQDRISQNKPLPKLMYINPTGCNPTGRNLCVKRKQEIYQLACEYNFLILEDDPYYFVHFQEENSPSLLSMDTEGRVIRLDSLSKILSSGLRLGFVTGPATLMRRIELHIQVTTLHTSALSQVLVSKLLLQWGRDQFLAHIQRVQTFYKNRRDLILAACNRYLTGLAVWDEPLGGMFLWLRVPVLQDTWSLATQDCVAHDLLVVPGHPFAGDMTLPHNNYIRLSFSTATADQMDKGIRLLAEIIKEKLNTATP